MLLKILKNLLNYFKLYKVDLLIVFISLISVGCTLLMIGNVFKNLVDQGLKTNNIAYINHSIILLCSLTIIFGVSSFFRSYFINFVTEKIIIDIKNKIYAHLINCQIFQFEDMKIGDLISRFSYDTEQIAKLIQNFFSFFLRNLIMLFGSLILMFCQSFKLSMIVIISIPILLFPLLRLSRYVRKLSRTTSDFQGTIAANIDESFSNIRLLHAYNQEQNKINEFKNHLNQYINLSSIRLKNRSLFFALALSAILLSIILVLWIGSKDIVGNDISPGQIVSFIYFALIAAMSGGGLAEMFSEVQLPLSSAHRVFDLLEIPLKEDEKSNFIHSFEHISPLKIEFNNVNFTYPSRSNYALKNISFSLESRFTGIIGPSGSGKSTLLQLLLKFYKTNSGSIKFDNTDINNIDTKNMRDFISYVPQDAGIFSGTIFSNIILSQSDCDLEKVQKIANITGITNFAKELEKGIHSEIGERGIKLSGGQKQRIALARALFHDAPILLLDEATSALDINDELELFDKLLDFTKDKKIIWIAHRLSSLKNADEILFINEGRVLFQGSYHEFLCKEDLYKGLVTEHKN